MLNPENLHLSGSWNFCIFCSALFSIVWCRRIHSHRVLTLKKEKGVKYTFVGSFYIEKCWPAHQRSRTPAPDPIPAFLLELSERNPRWIFSWNTNIFRSINIKYFKEIKITLVRIVWAPGRAGWRSQRCKIDQGSELPSPRCPHDWQQEAMVFGPQTKNKFIQYNDSDKVTF